MKISARSSGDRALASEAMCAGSIPAGRTIKKFKPSSSFARRLSCMKKCLCIAFKIKVSSSIDKCYDLLSYFLLLKPLVRYSFTFMQLPVKENFPSDNQSAVDKMIEKISSYYMLNKAW